MKSEPDPARGQGRGRVVGEAVVREVAVPLVKFLNQIQLKLHLWDEMAMCGKHMPHILVDVYRISPDRHLALPVLLIITRFGFSITPVMIDLLVIETNREATRWFREWNDG